MLSTVTCESCKARLAAKPEYAGKRLKCPKCGQIVMVPALVAVPAKSPSSQQTQIAVSGIDKDAVQAFQEFLNVLTAVNADPNPFRESKSRLVVNIQAIETGNTFVRYALLSLVGRPSVRAHFAFHQDGNVIIENTLKSSVYFQDSRDAGFRGRAFGGSNRSFVRTNCRRMTRNIVHQVLTALGTPASQQERYFAAVEGKSYDRTALIWMAIGAAILAVLFSGTAFVAAGPEERIPAIGGGLFIGTIFGGLLGAAAAGITSLLRKLLVPAK